MHIRTTCLIGGLAPILLASPLSSQSTKDRPQSVGKSGQLPEGWSARPDSGGDLKEIKYFRMDPGYHLTLGPATILYRREDSVSTPFHTLATFHQVKAPTHPEGYGLFIGGRDLKGPGQTYTYFLVRGDGKFNIKRRDGATLAQYTEDWESSSAVNQADAKGAATNLLEIDYKSDTSRVSFKVNGKEVHWVPAHMTDGSPQRHRRDPGQPSSRSPHRGVRYP
jgi:hypothetical protein